LVKSDITLTIAIILIFSLFGSAIVMDYESFEFQIVIAIILGLIVVFLIASLYFIRKENEGKLCVA